MRHLAALALLGWGAVAFAVWVMVAVAAVQGAA